MNATVAPLPVATLPAKVYVIDGNVDEIPTEITDAVWGCVKGSYQRDLLLGRETWSGSTLTGKAATYGGRYRDSRRDLVARIRATLRPFGWHAATALVLRDSRWHRELVIVDSIGTRYVW